MFKEIFIRLCNQKGESPSSVCRNVGIAPATFSCWTDESVPRKATLQRISDYFGVTTDYLLNGPKAEPDDTDEMTELLQELKTRPEMRMLFSLAKGATKEDVELAVAIIQRMRQSGDGE